MTIKVAIADDHPLVVNGVYHILSNCTDMEITGGYANGNELMAGLAVNRPDVLLLDIQMPGKTGDELAQEIAGTYPGVKMLALTNHDNVFYVKTMLRKGVHGYILKTMREETLLDAIRAVHRGEQYIEASLKEQVLRDALQKRKDLAIEPVLTQREKEVLKYIAADLTSNEIAEKLFVSKRTIDNHRISLLMKLGTKTVAAMVKRAIQLGLID